MHSHAASPCWRCEGVHVLEAVELLASPNLFLLAFSVLIFKVLVEEIVEGIVNALTETA
jgi:hypothetical protein